MQKKAMKEKEKIQNVSTAYIMKVDDDTFIRVDTILKEIEAVPRNKPLYMGNLNLLHRPMRNGKWAVTYELFKMEDVSMGMWVGRFNNTVAAVQYSHNWKFCQYGCMEGYFTAHYESPRQLLCLWDNLSRGPARCCNFR
ncbi:hypothetical protein VIGAN_05064300 [Vigna angularis var. angularis]|uniref:Hexosyltransferase n=1 Tax=Vigna angularis var. angularis TaxID=157739 RepID=A0A0S3S370_PHAAN|nr:hypothetical protein VIGAN_05064300 [Vigna angularis var. angularis]